MKIRLMISAAIISAFCAQNASAQVFTPEEADEVLAKPISLLDDEVMAQDDVDLLTFDPTISYYVQNLNLTPEQLDKAQRISEAGQAKKEDLLRQIEALRKEAYNLEAGSLIAFEAILDDDQRAAFHELQNNAEGADGKSQHLTDIENKNDAK